MLRRLSLLLAASALALPATASAATADLDRGFGDRGEVKFLADQTRAVALQPDGKLVLVADHKNAVGRVHRLTRDGKPDPTFGEQGMITLDLPGGTDRLRAVVIQPGGKIVVGGSVNGRSRLWRFDTHGRPDPSFGTDGVVAVTTENTTENLTALTIAPDGKLVAAGETVAGLGDAIVWRRHGHDGSPDATFNNGGKFHFGLDPESLDGATGVAVQADGRILVTGKTDADAFVARLDPVIKFDETFREKGKVRLDVGGTEVGHAIAALPDGKIVVAGQTTVGHNGIVWRMDSTGAPDGTFNGIGVQFIDSAADEVVRAVLPQRDGKLVLVGGTTAGAGGGDSAFYRLTEGGKLDVTFEGDGAIGYDSGAAETLHGAALQEDGNIVGVGTSGGYGIVYRLLGDPHVVTVGVSGPGRVVSDPAGLDCPGRCSAPFDVGTVVRLRASVGANAGFTGWFGAPCTGGECALKVHGPLTVGADFFALPAPPVVVEGGLPPRSGGGPGTPPPDTTAPRITRAWVVGRTINFRLSEAARVTATVKRGKRVITRVSGDGRSLKIRKRLARGRYSVELVAVDAARNRSSRVVLRMRVS
ncbi:hypothetical protein OJ997_04675 [Solirubrobacter phytolaccae]|uniref:Bacterial repeat domain-containing protein n=1 Tax=Solirubrobacter phytolaccae TaxID=1404360 RepID=A0A9X3N6W6_9ACTN|nr:hypothetical protein [Solirubrobacter phytolaccae]MDA0179580.1 hypothetical protein [Solirubrobacter phytolaccae]